MISSCHRAHTANLDARDDRDRLTLGRKRRTSIGFTCHHAASWVFASRNIRRRWHGSALRGACERPAQGAGGGNLSYSFHCRPTRVDPIRCADTLRFSRGHSSGALPGRRAPLSVADQQLRALLRMVSARRESQLSGRSVVGAPWARAARDNPLDRACTLRAKTIRSEFRALRCDERQLRIPASPRLNKCPPFSRCPYARVRRVDSRFAAAIACKAIAQFGSHSWSKVTTTLPISLPLSTASCASAMRSRGKRAAIRCWNPGSRRRALQALIAALRFAAVSS